jgi:nitrogen fixation NifU-like protein
VTSELRELYQQVILDHNRAPRTFRRLSGASRRAEGHNPLCGDRVLVELAVDDGVIRDVAFQGSGCAISRAAASLMTDAVRGRTVAEADALFGRFHELVAGGPGGGAGAPALGKLEVFSGVREFPARVKCAVLPWHTLRAALAGQAEPVTTE